MWRSKSAAVLFTLTAVNVIWGVNYAAAKIALRDLSPFTFAFTRLGLALVLMLPLGLRAGLIPSLGRQGLRPFLLVALLGLLAPQASFAISLKLAPSSLLAVLSALAPVLIALLAVVFLREHMARRGWVGIALGLVGVLLVLGVAPSELGVNGLHALLGGVIFILGSLCWAAYNIHSKHLVVHADPVALATGALLFGTLGMAVLFGGERVAGVSSTWTWPAFGCVLFGAVSTFLGFMGTTWALKHAAGTRVGAFQYLQPVVGILTSWMLLGERLGPAFIGGALLIGGGVVLTALAHIHTLPAAAPAVDQDLAPVRE